MVQHERKDSAVVESFSIYYECDSTTVNPDYLSNKAHISRILHYVKNSPRIDSITIYSWSSPEGREEYNLSLSKERARAAKRSGSFLYLGYSVEVVNEEGLLQRCPFPALVLKNSDDPAQFTKEFAFSVRCIKRAQ